ncbi:ABC transporter permease [Pseudonocardiaceae bacterium YIM PH 21723]|nr:ABC transporter permease [Pseudonocardiaceae bacterium YIM PH 21723]
MVAGVVGTATSALGRFYATCLDTFRLLFARPVQWREMVTQAWFIVGVTVLPTLLMAIPFCVVVIFQLNLLLSELGANDIVGAATGLAVIKELGPMVSALVVAGAGATAICADLGARKYGEEIEAMRTLGLNPIQRLVVPRVIASGLVALCMNSVVCVTGLLGGLAFSVFVQGTGFGLFLANLSLLTDAVDVLIGEIKALVFGVLAALVACHLGLNAKGGPKGVGDAVNQTVVFGFIALFVANVFITLIVMRIRG